MVAALLPSGGGTLDAVARLVRDVGGMAEPGGDGTWSAHPNLRVTAVDLDAGRRVVFGDPGAPRVGLPEAVTASCAIPGWFAPVVLDGVRYVDGGAWSATNVDVAAGRALDEVVVLAPMVSFAPGAVPTTWRARVERRWRQAASRRCLREVDAVHAEGTQVTVLGPGAEDLQVMGSNLMDVDRRRRVLDTSLRTSAAALSDPGPRTPAGPRRRQPPTGRPRPGRRLMRVYVPCTLALLASASRRGGVGPAPLAAHAVTPALRESYAQGDAEELEFSAQLHAAEDSLRLLADDPAAARRRVVLAADVPDAEVRADSRDVPSAVRLAREVPLARVVSVHVDEEGAVADVAAAVGALPAADAGDDDARFTVDSAEGHDLLWYDVSELADLVGEQ